MSSQPETAAPSGRPRRPFGDLKRLYGWGSKTGPCPKCGRQANRRDVIIPARRLLDYPNPTDDEIRATIVEAVNLYKAAPVYHQKCDPDTDRVRHNRRCAMMGPIAEARRQHAAAVDRGVKSEMLTWNQVYAALVSYAETGAM